MNYIILDKVIELLKLKSVSLDDESIGYFPKKYPFTQNEYLQLFYDLDKMIPEKEYTLASGMFPEYKGFFEYKNFKFIWCELVGQGTACMILPEEKGFNEQKKIIIKETK